MATVPAPAKPRPLLDFLMLLLSNPQLLMTLIALFKGSVGAAAYEAKGAGDAVREAVALLLGAFAKIAETTDTAVDDMVANTLIKLQDSDLLDWFLSKIMSDVDTLDAEDEAKVSAAGFDFGTILQLIKLLREARKALQQG